MQRRPRVECIRGDKAKDLRYRAVRGEGEHQAARYEALSANRKRISRLALRESGEDPFGRVGENALDSDQGGICIARDRELTS